MRKALIVGHTGQDGTYLYEYLQQFNYKLVGISGNKINSTFKNSFTKPDITKKLQVEKLVRSFLPDEIYFLAAVHHSSAEDPGDAYTLFYNSIKVNVEALYNLLESIRKFAPACRLFYAASSHVFGNPEEAIQDETTPFNPDNIYGITKTAGIHLCRFYHLKYNVYASTGIFYNHESPLRASKFVSKKIVEAAVAIKFKKQKKLTLGNLESRIDWGYAPDYVRAAHAILQLKKPDTFVICSGQTHSVKDFLEISFSYLDLDWRKFVETDKKIIAKSNRAVLQGDSSKLHRATGWKPEVTFKEMIRILVNDELKKYAGK